VARTSRESLARKKITDLLTGSLNFSLSPRAAGAPALQRASFLSLVHCHPPSAGRSERISKGSSQQAEEGGNFATRISSQEIDIDISNKKEKKNR
jgi:hypothetical protein